MWVETSCSGGGIHSAGATMPRGINMKVIASILDLILFRCAGDQDERCKKSFYRNKCRVCCDSLPFDE